ncbi:hypothetical protein CONLIGDRAFT_680352 [Coniochaeta ligniaria NRRL 30616]|uniref:Alpha/beta-hydrolase n=1 Tax=Coniochaeta ligniaria NRRL 30616 TaxID=1408157 RepID=A0A1J7IQM7_9PEZI|nr:hypothetical protein CONLIGDRAFT_680352 [Coniochaeta ligniaria NRRL 30616]
MSFPFSDIPGYEAKTLTYKTVDGIDLKLDTLLPTDLDSSPTPIVIHYTVTEMDLHLLPEATAHEAVDDALDAYTWVRCLSVARGRSSRSTVFWILPTSATSPRAPISWGIPPIETGPVLELFPSASRDGKPPVSGYAWPEDLMRDDHFAFVMALHIEALLPDFATGIVGLGQGLAAKGLDVIPESEKRLFIGAFGYPSGLPPVFFLHGRDDAAVPFRISESAADRLGRAGAEVTTEFPDSAQHGFDALLGRVEIEADCAAQSSPVAVDGLRRVLRFLDQEMLRG